MSSSLSSPKPSRVAVFAQLTPRLLFCCFIGAIGEIIYGYDVSSFGGVQAIPAFKSQFGTCNAAGVCAISTTNVAIMNSFASIGKFLGCFVVGNFLERFGHRWTLVTMCLLNFLGAILEISSKTVAQFVVGRVILYFSVAFAEVSVTTYQAEICPASMRAFVVSGLQFFITVGGLLAAGINKAYSTHTTPDGWMIPVGVTMAFPFAVLCGIPFIPDAPRWLVFRGRREEALASLKKLRPKADVDAGNCEAELEAIVANVEAVPEKGSWLSTLRGTNLRRTLIVIFVMTAQQCTGQAFVSQYGIVFYISVGLGAKAFDYGLIASGLTLVPVLGAMYALDRLGRRPIYIFGGVFMGFWMFCIAGFGGKVNPSSSEINMMVASIMIYGLAFGLTWAPAPYATAAETSSNSLREKTMALGAAAQSLSGWAVSFVLPYLLNQPYAGLGPRVGYIFGSVCCSLSVMAYFIIPETRGRTLEELDELFEAGLKPWQFAGAVTHLTPPVSALAAATGAVGGVEAGADGKQSELEHVEGEDKEAAVLARA